MEIKKTIKFSTDPLHILFTSEPYVIHTRFGFQAVIDAKNALNDEEGIVFLSPSSLANRLNEIIKKRDNKFKDLELIIFKESEEQKAKYVVEEP
tara:strand:- start:55 stop:336 length:282 start_codon:yes stop_codon:yes gene_type:complete